jgi:hypothetical protein
VSQFALPPQAGLATATVAPEVADMRFKPTSRRAKALAALCSALVSGASLAVVLVGVVDAAAPVQDAPWKPLRIADPVGAATAYKIRALKGRPDRCVQILREGGVRSVPAPDLDDGAFCVVADAVKLQGGTTPLQPRGLSLRCPLAVSYAIWDRQVLQPAARESFGRRVDRVETYGSYACRRVYGHKTGSPSQHARANAVDVAGVRLVGGRTVSVLKGWSGDKQEARFLRRLRDGACRTFSMTLSPDYNSAHRDHLHLDAGGWSGCH